jgi:coenzyme A diphosphatase NUDT7
MQDGSPLHSAFYLYSDILIRAASIAYNQTPDFTVYTPNQIPQTGLIKIAFTGPLAVKKRRVRPRMFGFQQPQDDDHAKGDDSSQSSNKQKQQPSPSTPAKPKSRL